MSRRTSVLVGLGIVLLTPAVAIAVPTPVKLEVGLTPERLGSGTTISFGFKVSYPPHTFPPVLASVRLLYPAHIDLATSELGLRHCTTQILEIQGPEGCPRDALMGYGTAEAAIPTSSEIIHETADITVWMGPVQNGRPQLLFAAEGYTPIRAELYIPSIITKAPPPYGGELATTIPAIESIPEAPSPALVEIKATIGPKNITYYLHSHGRTLAFQPAGLLLPTRCPRGGFHFAANFTFQDGKQTVDKATVPCPTRH